MDRTNTLLRSMLHLLCRGLVRQQLVILSVRLGGGGRALSVLWGEAFDHLTLMWLVSAEDGQMVLSCGDLSLLGILHLRHALLELQLLVLLVTLVLLLYLLLLLVMLLRVETSVVEILSYRPILIPFHGCHQRSYKIILFK